MDNFFKKLLQIILIKIVLISMIFFLFFNEPSLSDDAVQKQKQIEQHFINKSGENND